MGEISYDYENGHANGHGNGSSDSDVVKFPPNVPVSITMKYAKPRTIQTRRGIRYMISTITGEVAFLDADPALKIETLAVKPRERFWICHKTTGEKGDLGHWDVWLDPTAEEARAKKAAPPAPAALPVASHGTLAVPKAPESTPAVPEARPKTQLEDALLTVVSACHKAQEHARQIGYTAMPQFTGEDIRTMANTLIIGMQRRDA